MSEDFDPDAFLAEQEGFDPDAFLESAKRPGARGLEVAAPAKDKMLVPSTMLGSVLESLGIVDPAVQRAGAPQVGGGETMLNRTVNALPAGGLVTDLASTGLMEFLGGGTPGARLTPKAQAELRSMGEQVDQPTLVDVYRRLRDTRKARDVAGGEQNPGLATLGTGTGLALSVLAPLPKAVPKVAAGASKPTLGALMKAGAKTGAGYGGLAGLTSGPADLTRGEVGATLAQAMMGAGMGAGLGAAVPAGVAGVRRLAQGLVTPTPAAKALQAAGVKDLTLGQMDPKSPMGAMEGTGQATPGLGPVLQGQREAAPASWRDAVFKAALPPGAKPPPEGATTPEAMAHIRKAFNASYDAIKETPVPTKAIDRLLLAADDQSVVTTDAERQAVAKFLQNQMSVLPPSGTETTAGVLMKVRSNIRDAIRKALDSDKGDIATLLQRAEQELTDGLQQNLPDDAAKLLQATDGQYRNFKIIQDAVMKAKDSAEGQGIFSPERLVTAVQRNTAPGAYDQGGGGPLRQLAANAVQAFQEPPKTGWSALGGPFVRYTTTPALILANQPGVKPYMLGQAPIQQSMRRVDAAIAPYLENVNLPPQNILAQLLMERLRRNQEGTPNDTSHRPRTAPGAPGAGLASRP